MGDVTLYNFGNNAIVKINDILFTINQNNELSLMYCASLQTIYNSSGVVLFRISSNNYLLVDLTFE